MDSNFINAGYEKKLNHLLQLREKKEYKEMISNLDELDKLQKKVCKSNLDLAHIDLKELQSQSKRNSKILESQKINSIKVILENNKLDKNDNKIIINKENNSKTINNNKLNEKINNIKTTIFRDIGKKVKNFPKNFDNKTMLLIEIFQKFKEKVKEVHNKFNFL